MGRTKIYTDEELKERIKESKRRYNKTTGKDKVKEANLRYQQSDAYKKYKKEYNKRRYLEKKKKLEDSV